MVIMVKMLNLDDDDDMMVIVITNMFAINLDGDNG